MMRIHLLYWLLLKNLSRRGLSQLLVKTLLLYHYHSSVYLYSNASKTAWNIEQAKNLIALELSRSILAIHAVWMRYNITHPVSWTKKCYKKNSQKPRIEIEKFIKNNIFWQPLQRVCSWSRRKDSPDFAWCKERKDLVRTK